MSAVAPGAPEPPRLSGSPEATEALGAALGPALVEGDAVLLIGPLGAGKTRFVAGLARGVGATRRVRSPSFTLVNEYRGACLLYHLDLYRLEAPLADALFLRDVLYGDGVAAVEWFERLPSAAGDEVLLVTLRFTLGGGRAVRLEARGARHERLLLER